MLAMAVIRKYFIEPFGLNAWLRTGLENGIDEEC
jgi:hypothetical protein